MMTRYELAHEVSRIKPGDCFCIHAHVLRELGHVHLTGFMGPSWSPAEQIMENIVGSAYEFTYTEDPMTGNVTFRRLKSPLPYKTGLRTYMSPDRRDGFRQRWNGLWERAT